MSSQMFEVAWEEVSRRATDEARREHADPAADVRYYAEKHQSTWQVDLDELPPVRVLVLLRDPRVAAVEILTTPGSAEIIATKLA